MSKKTFTVIFFKDGTHEYLEKENGVRVLIKPDTEVVSVYNATSRSDAKIAIDAFTPGPDSVTEEGGDK